jgi:hypothetical protein
MGAVNPKKMPSGKRKARRDDTDFTEYKSGGKVRLNSKRARFAQTLKKMGK